MYSSSFKYFNTMFLLLDFNLSFNLHFSLRFDEKCGSIFLATEEIHPVNHLRCTAVVGSDSVFLSEFGIFSVVVASPSILGKTHPSVLDANVTMQISFPEDVIDYKQDVLGCSYNAFPCISNVFDAVRKTIECFVMLLHH
jgi:hypothetical protein